MFLYNYSETGKEFQIWGPSDLRLFFPYVLVFVFTTAILFGRLTNEERKQKRYCIYVEFKTFSVSKIPSAVIYKSTSYELLSLRVVFIARVTSCKLLFIAQLRVKSYSLLHELRVTVCIRVMSYCLLLELRVTFCMRVTSYCLLCELLF